MRYVTGEKGNKVVISRSGEIVIEGPNGRERERHKIPYGANLLASDGQQVEIGTELANWDPMTRPIVTEYAGKVRFANVIDNVTVKSQVDEVTGLSSLVVIDAKHSSSSKIGKPLIQFLDANNEPVKIPGTEHPVSIQLPVGALIIVHDGDEAKVGDVLARRKARRLETLPAVCRVLPSSSKPALRRTQVFLPRQAVPLPSVRKPRANSV